MEVIDYEAWPSGASLGDEEVDALHRAHHLEPRKVLGCHRWEGRGRLGLVDVWWGGLFGVGVGCLVLRWTVSLCVCCGLGFLGAKLNIYLAVLHTPTTSRLSVYRQKILFAIRCQIRWSM